MIQFDFILLNLIGELVLMKIQEKIFENEKIISQIAGVSVSCTKVGSGCLRITKVAICVEKDF